MFAQPPAPTLPSNRFSPRSPQTPAQVDYRLLYTQRSLGDLADIIGHIAEDDPEAASRFGNSLARFFFLIAVKSPAGFPAQPSRGHIFLQQWARAILRVA